MISISSRREMVQAFGAGSLMAAQVCAPIIASGSLGSSEDRALISSAFHVALSDNSFAPFMEECNRQLILSGSQVRFDWTPEIQSGNFLTKGPEKQVEFTQSYGIKLIDSIRSENDPNNVLDHLSTTLSKKYCAKAFSDVHFSTNCFDPESRWTVPTCIDQINSKPISDYQKWDYPINPSVLEIRPHRDINRLRKGR